MRLPFAHTAVLACAVLGGALARPVDAQLVRIPGTSVTLVAPPGFQVARKFAGLENPDTGSSITVSEFPPDSYADLAKAFSSPRTAASRFDVNGVRITRIEQIDVDSGQIPVAVGGQEVRNQEVMKYIALMGGAPMQAKTVLLTLNIADSSRIGHTGVESILKSVRLAHEATLAEKLTQLSFTFKSVAPFRPQDMLPGGIVILASFEGREPAGDRPVLLIGRAATSATPAETPQTAERILHNTGGLADAEIVDQATATFAGGPAHYIEAVAGDQKILQFLRVLPGGTYIQLLARGGTKEIDDVRAAVKEIADSVELAR